MQDRFRLLRRALDWSQHQLAVELGVSQPTIWRIEHGLADPSKSVAKLFTRLEADAAAGAQHLRNEKSLAEGRT